MRGRVSVIIPTFNRATLLPDAMRSVLRQTHRDLELIVVDDGSTDDTPQVVASFDDARLQYVPIEHTRSAARARNVGLARATGRFVAFLDSDDVWQPEKVQKQLEALEGSRRCRWSYTRFDHIDANGAPMAPLRGGVGLAVSGWILPQMITQDAVVMVQSVLAETSLVKEVGPFDESPALREDLEFCFRLAARSEACALEENLLRIRHHPMRTTFALPEVRDWRVKALRKLASSTADGSIRRLCRRECRREVVELAETYEWAGRPGAALRMLARALRYGPFDVRIWTVLAKTLARRLAPRPLVDAYRRARERRQAARVESAR
jgi:glycosyltransferase involved in cell wall biosynthesis